MRGIDADGNPQWAATADVEMLATLEAGMAIDPQGRVVVAGTCTRSLSFGAADLDFGEAGGLFVAQWGSSGALDRVKAYPFGPHEPAAGSEYIVHVAASDLMA